MFSISDSDYYSISHKVLNKLIGQEFYTDDNEEEIMPFKNIKKIYNRSPIDESRYKLKYDTDTKEVKLEDIVKPKSTTISYTKDLMNKYLNNKKSRDIINFFGLKLPSEYKDKSLEEFQEALDKGMKEVAILKKNIKDVADYKKDSITGLTLAYPKAGQNARQKTKDLIKQHNIMEIFNSNMLQLRNYKSLTGSGIIHFNNPQKLVNRLELLAGSIFAGNNGVKQEFSQIAHLLHQLKVITKKQLNDLLKKHILFK